MTIGVRVDHEVVEAIRRFGELQNRTLSNMCGVALTDWARARGLVKAAPKATEEKGDK